MTLKKYIDTKIKATFEKPTDDATYQIEYITYRNDTGAVQLGDASAKYLSAYAKGKPGKMQYTLELSTKAITEYPLSGMQYGSVVPYWVKM